MSKPVILNVPDTAFMVAMDRALESERPDALFLDPFAAKLAGERGKVIAQSFGRESDIRRWTVALRTVIIDDFIKQAVERGIDAVLNLGAGLDSRPYRLALPSKLHWVEVDYPSIIDLKEARLADDVPSCHVERVKLDLAVIDARRAFFGSVAKRFQNVLVLTEGVIPYLSVDEVAIFADDLKAIGNVREWIVDYISPEVIKFRQSTQRDFENAPFKFMPDDWHAFFEAHGWRSKEERYFVEEGAKRNRAFQLIDPAAIERAKIAMPANASRFAGYFAMEPVGTAQ